MLFKNHRAGKGGSAVGAGSSRKVGRVGLTEKVTYEQMPGHRKASQVGI